MSKTIMEQKIDRINELYHKSQTRQGLTEEEVAEQKSLRAEYVQAVRANLRGQLNQIDIVENDGSITNLKEKYGKEND